MVNNQFQAYQNNAVMTASGDKLTLMLYNGAIRFCNQAKAALENKEIQEAHTSLIKAQNIIEQLQVTLDDKYPITAEFDKMYEFINYQLAEANLTKNVENIDVALDFIREIRDTWQEAMKLSNRA